MKSLNLLKGYRMKAWLLKDFGLDNLQLEEVPTPTPKTGELLLKIEAVSLNFRDKAIIDGIYEPQSVPKPLIPVSDAVGIVVAVGEGVSRFAVGDRVNTTLYTNWLDGAPAHNEPDYCIGMPLPGALAEYMVFPEKSAVKAPDNMSAEDAATLPIAALTVWYALKDIGNLQAGQTVLVQGTGGVSIFAIQLAHALGAKVIATSSKDENLAKVSALGADKGINYKQFPQWEEKVLELTDGFGVDITIDVAGGQGINQSILATKVGGTVAQIGFLSGQSCDLNLMPLIFRQTNLQGICVAPRSSFERMNEFLSQHQIKPVIDQVYSFEQAKEAFEHLAKGAFGKIVIKM